MYTRKFSFLSKFFACVKMHVNKFLCGLTRRLHFFSRCVFSGKENK